MSEHPATLARVGSLDLTWAGGGPVEGPVDERDADGYADLRTYATIGDGRTIALVARDGRIDWLPLPDVSSVAAFGALLDAENGGNIGLCPTTAFSAGRRYVPGTNVLETTFTTATGSVRVTDSLNTGVAGRLPWAELGRRIEGVDGEVELRAEVAPGTFFNQASPWVHSTVHGKVLRVDGLTLAVRTLADAGVEVDDRRIGATFRTSPGSRHLLGLVATEREALTLVEPEAIDEGIDRTVANWRAWSGTFSWDGPWQPAVERSAMVLKQLIYAPTGALAAAATTSLPESLAGGKNWDYRFAWIRDTAYALTALFRFGVREETHSAISWLLRTMREFSDEPAVFYTLGGGLATDQPTQRDSPGWRGLGPVVRGNGARDQLQLGVFGDVFSIVQLYVDHGNVLDDESGRLLTLIADRACDRWRSRDSGMWELPELQHFTTSKLGCWQALHQAAHLSEIGQLPGSADRWRSEAEEIRAWVDRHAWSEELGGYEWYPGSGKLDASILLHAISGFDRGERMSATLDAVRRELGAGPHLYRYSGAADEEGVFVACSYWMVSALQLVGREQEAAELMEELMAAPNDVGLLAEMIEPESGAFLGNLPQALSHLALLNAAITVHTGNR
ncbi:glycoside hydrolase family 15 protein [uncultured Friedmanniella sp.]|uniref:glycoside hydrolase family 15 protein n=1 Tax=uncultured Friedmanniella sp. TaxID=335381 RepID=UPI0035CC8CB3